MRIDLYNFVSKTTEPAIIPFSASVWFRKLTFCVRYLKRDSHYLRR